MRSLPSEKETDLAQNKSLAEWNLSQQPRLEQLKKQVINAIVNFSIAIFFRSKRSMTK